MKRCHYFSLFFFTLFISGFLLVRAQETSLIDSDGDGLNDQQEINIYHTDPNKADTDNDGYSDGLEIAHNFSPLQAGGKKMSDVDTDSDGLKDDWEIALGTDLTNPDTDGDGYKDGSEINNSYDPLSVSKQRVTKQIVVNTSDQTLSYSFNNKLLGQIKISSGTKGFETPKGSFTVIKKIPSITYKGPGYNYPNTKWNLLFAQKKYNYYIHGAYWHNNFGQPASHGCVNVSYNDMPRLYDWADTSTKITVN